jgi:exodeoxyribonuclease III
MTVATFNAASVRARLPILLDWLARHEPDVLAIQETKVEDDKFPIAEFEELGYHVAVHGQKSWNGVATLSRSPIGNPRCGFGDDLFPTDCRILAGEIDGIPFINTYVPNGNSVGSEKWEYKLRWLERFDRYLRENFAPDRPLVWLGDINIAPTADDVHNSKRFYGGVGHHPDEFERLDRILRFGLVDVFRMHHQGPGHYTFWDFTIPKAAERNLGWRIDHIYATSRLAQRCTSAAVDREPRLMERPSDHTFVVAEFDLEEPL